MHRAALIALFALVACADPRAVCLSAATEEIRTVDSLIAETEGNLRRGYALQRQPSLSTNLRLCTRTGPTTLCAERDAAAEERPVAIDTAAERAKLASLRERRRLLAVETDAAIAACEGRLPMR